MINRRTFVQGLAGLPLALLLPNQINQTRGRIMARRWHRDEEWFMPDEGDPHVRTWMSFGADETTWGKKLVEEVRRNLALVAQTIARFEPVTLCVREEEAELAKKYFSSLDNIEWLFCPLDDLWIRDYGAVFLVNEAGDRAAVDFNFNGWGEKQEFEQDAKVAALIAEHVDVELVETDLILEGGGIEVDGEGTAIITESCVRNENRNPGVSKSECEEELMELLGLDKILWLPGVKDADITDGHTDFYARFAGPGVVVAGLEPNPKLPDHQLTRRHLEILQGATDAKGRKLRVVTLDGPTKVRDPFASDDFCAGYINFYLCNGAVIATEFGDEKADGAAREKLQELFPDREIVMLNIDGIAAGGGGIHCATQQEPAA